MDQRIIKTKNKQVIILTRVMLYSIQNYLILLNNFNFIPKELEFCDGL